MPIMAILVKMSDRAIIAEKVPIVSVVVICDKIIQKT
jgi:hypothetical protein